MLNKSSENYNDKCKSLDKVILLNKIRIKLNKSNQVQLVGVEVWHWRRCLRRKTGSQTPPFFTLTTSTLLHQTSENHPPTSRSFFTSRTRFGALLTMNTMTIVTRANVAEENHVPHLPRHPMEEVAREVTINSVRCGMLQRRWHPPVDVVHRHVPLGHQQ